MCATTITLIMQSDILQLYHLIENPERNVVAKTLQPYSCITSQLAYKACQIQLYAKQPAILLLVHAYVWQIFQLCMAYVKIHISKNHTKILQEYNNHMSLHSYIVIQQPFDQIATRMLNTMHLVDINVDSQLARWCAQLYLR